MLNGNLVGDGGGNIGTMATALGLRRDFCGGHRLNSSLKHLGKSDVLKSSFFTARTAAAAASKNAYFAETSSGVVLSYSVTRMSGFYILLASLVNNVDQLDSVVLNGDASELLKAAVKDFKVRVARELDCCD